MGEEFGGDRKEGGLDYGFRDFLFLLEGKVNGLKRRLCEI